MARDELLLGAVAYDPKVVTIWDGFQRFFAQAGLPFDYVLTTSYERLVDLQLAGEVDVAWNSPLAWIQAERVARARGRVARAVAMRDTDQDLASVVLVRADSPLRAAADLRGKRLGLGAKDSPQAALIPLIELERAGVGPAAFQAVWHDVLVGKHGDHVGGERDAVKALLAGEVDAACLLDSNQLLFAREGTLPSGAARVLLRTAAFDHCNFTVLDPPHPRLACFLELLMGMRYEDPAVRGLMDLEGLKAWRTGRTSGYELLEAAVDRAAAWSQAGLSGVGELSAWLAARGVK